MSTGINHKHYIRHKRIFTESEWDAATGLDKLYIYLMEPDKWDLNSVESNTLDSLRTAWAIICKDPRPRNRIIKVCEALGIKERFAQEIIANAKNLFGDILDVDIWLEHRLGYQRLMVLFKHAQEAKDWATAAKIQQQATALIEKIQESGQTESKQYQPIKITTNPAALVSKLPEYIEFEETHGVVPEQ